MPPGWERRLRIWEDARLIAPADAARIREFEARREHEGGWRWPVVLAWVFGGVLIGAGVLLFVAAHWERLSPSARFALVMLMVAVLHGAGALVRAHAEALGHVLHAAGTVALGAGIFLTGQIFNLREHWPGGVMLWAAGAWLGWLLLRDRAQAALAAILTPVWIGGEWVEATTRMRADGVLAEGAWLLALVYLAARSPRRDGPVRGDLVWIGGLAIIPLSFWAALASGGWSPAEGGRPPVPALLVAAGWIVGYGGPLVLGWLLRREEVWPVIAAAVWVRLLGIARPEWVAYRPDSPWDWIAVYLLCAAGSALMAWWGILESRRERVSLGVAGFGLTVLCFYFDNVMDKLGRSVSLMSLGLLLLAGGYLLERTRRRLIARLEGESR